MSGPLWLLNRTALAAHRRYLAEHGGPSAVCFPKLFVALGWPRSVLAFAGGRASVFELAAAHAEGMLRVRPFASANTAMAYVFTLMFLAINRQPLPADRVERLAMFRTFQIGAIDRSTYARWMLLRSVAPAGATVVGVRRDRFGRVVGLGLLKSTVPAARVGDKLAKRAPDPELVQVLLN